jgi:Fic family protein
MKLPEAPVPWAAQMEALSENGRPVDLIVSSRTPVDDKGRYLHWDEVRSRTPPTGLDVQTWWLSMRLARDVLARELPLLAKDGSPFQFSNVDEVQRSVHEVDQQIGGRVGTTGDVSAERTRRFVRSLEEEAITSSQLEGATTTRRDAKRLLATGRPARDLSEQMILNNFNAMLRVKELVGAPLTPTTLLDLHRIVTEGTLDDPAESGRLQTPDDDRIGVYAHDDTLVHEPPPASELPDRLDALCAFANGATGEGFMHPVVRAIVLHFMMSYDHPFSDGNGRTARALFYWSMLDSGYSLIEYVSISSLLRQAPSRYTRSFLYTETDTGDVTYFVLRQLQILLRAIDALWAYVDRRAAETTQIESLVRSSDALNHRQLALIRDALQDPNEPMTIAEHQRTHRVTNETARSDLLGLERLGLYDKRKRGKAFTFLPKPGLEERLRALGDAS